MSQERWEQALRLRHRADQLAGRIEDLRKRIDEKKAQLVNAVHPTHAMEDDKERFFDHVWYCKRCGRVLKTRDGGITDRGREECPGPQRVVLREVA